MKREIKFRAFHKFENLMCDVDVLTRNGAFLIGVKNGPDELTDGGKMIVISPKNGRFCLNDEFELMQFTGLYDVNGKEIYEGDILITGNKQVANSLDMLVVKYSGSSFVIYNPNCCDACRHGSGAIGGLDEYGFNHYRVIGNIYENPELL